MALDRTQIERPCWAAVARPIFIVGAARSGTTLLRRLLSAHPRLAISPETHFMKLADRFGAAERAAPAEPERFWAALRAHLELRAIDIDVAHARALWRERGGDSFRSIFAALLAAQAARAGKARVGEKTPGHEHYLARLFDWFPDARVICVYRDPRATAASSLNTPWVREQVRPAQLSAPLVRRLRAYHLIAKAHEWRDSMEEIDAFAGDARVATCAYEELVRAPEASTRRLCGFLGEDWTAAMLTGAPTTLVAADKSGMRWRDWTLAHERQATKPISVDSAERWRCELAEHEIALIEAACGERLSAAGYAAQSSAQALRRGRFIADALRAAERTERGVRHASKRLLARNAPAPQAD